jgi:hypothetical protein
MGSAHARKKRTVCVSLRRPSTTVTHRRAAIRKQAGRGRTARQLIATQGHALKAAHEGADRVTVGACGRGAAAATVARLPGQAGKSLGVQPNPAQVWGWSSRRITAAARQGGRQGGLAGHGRAAFLKLWVFFESCPSFLPLN